MMGVKHLWDIIDETKNKENLDYLRGKIVSVDLSIWIVEAIKTLQYKTSVVKPHLRNIFYRILALRKLGIKLLFVTEGDAPELKQNTMKKRNEGRYGVKTKTKSRVGRSRFQSTIRECCHLLDLLGMPYIRAAGEAEAMCAELNLQGYSDGCLTNDGDFLLYGGQTIFRDFGIDPKDPHVFVYDMEKIKSRLNVNRNDMIGLALLCGCDYTNGIAGVGKGLITNFLEERSFSEDLLNRFKKWQCKDFLTSKDLKRSEVIIARKAMKADDFFNQQVIDEFLESKDVMNNVNEKLKWGYPNIKGLQQFLLTKMEWPHEYTLSKVMQLASSTYLEKIEDNIFYPVVISPTHIVKTRSQYGVALVEVNWEKDTSLVYGVDVRWDNCPDTFTTLENHQVVLKLLPVLVETFIKLKESKKTGKTKKKEIKVKKGEKCTKETNIKLDNNATEDDTSRLINRNLEKEDHSNVFSVDSQESQASQQYGLDKTRDFLTDILCQDMKDISLHDVVATKPCISEDNDGDKENILPLFKRLQRKKISEKNQSDSEDEECKSMKENFIAETISGVEVYSQLKKKRTPVKQKVTSNLIEMNTNILDSFCSPFLENKHTSMIDKSSPAYSKQSKTEYAQLIDPINSSKFPHNILDNERTPLREKHFTQFDMKKYSPVSAGISLMESTPVIFQIETPMLLRTDTPKSMSSKHSSALSSSTPLFREAKQSFTNRSPLLKDITNFSNLGDSIFDHSMDSFDYNKVETCKELNSNRTPYPNLHKSHYEQSMLCKSLDIIEPSILISKMSGFGDSILCDSLDLAVCNTSTSINNPGNIQKVSENYEDLLRKKFQLSLLTCDDVSMGSISKCSNNSSKVIDDFPMVEGSPLCLADRLKTCFK